MSNLSISKAESTGQGAGTDAHEHRLVSFQTSERPGDPKTHFLFFVADASASTGSGTPMI